MASVTLDNSPTTEDPSRETLATKVVLTTINGVQTWISQTVAPTGVPGAVASSDPTTSVVTKTENIPAATQSTETQQPTGPPLSTLLPAIVAPVVFILILASIVLFTCLHYRNKKRERERLRSYDEATGPTETAFLNRRNSQSFTLPSPLGDHDRLKEGQLGVFEKRRSMISERSRGNGNANGDMVAMSDRTPQDPEKYATPRAPPPIVKPGGAPPRSRSRPSQQQRRQQQQPGSQPQQPPLRSPPQRYPLGAPGRASPALQPPPKDTAPSWPLPADALPSPESMQSAKTSQSRPRVERDMSDFQLPPLHSTEPFSMREELRPDSDTYDLSTSAATGAPRNGHQAQDSLSSNPFSTYSDMTSERKRESDAVSELSFDARDRRSRARDPDTLSVVSAISHD